ISVRANAENPRRKPEQRRRRLHERFHGPRILAVRVSSTGGRQIGANGHRISSYASACELQPRGRKERGRGKDQGPRGPVVGRDLSTRGRSPESARNLQKDRASGGGEQRHRSAIELTSSAGRLAYRSSACTFRHHVAAQGITE